MEIAKTASTVIVLTFNKLISILKQENKQKCTHIFFYNK